MSVCCIIFLKTVVCVLTIAFVSLFNTAGGVVGSQTFNPDAPLVVHQSALHILQLTVPNVTASASSTWRAYLMLNNACIEPADAIAPGRGELGPQCIGRATVMRSYDIRLAPNVTAVPFGINGTEMDMSVICVANSGIQPVEYSGKVYLGCSIDAAHDKPKYTFETGAIWFFYLLGSISSFVALVASWKFCRKGHKPAGIFIRLLPWIESLLFFIANCVVTVQARAAVAWVQGQHSDKVIDPQLGTMFFGLSWSLVFIPFVGLGLQHWAEGVDAKMRTTAPPRSSSSPLPTYVEDINLDPTHCHEPAAERPPPYRSQLASAEDEMQLGTPRRADDHAMNPSLRSMLNRAPTR